MFLNFLDNLIKSEMEVNEKLKEIQDYIEKIYEISKLSNISKDEIVELFKMIFEEEL